MSELAFRKAGDIPTGRNDNGRKGVRNYPTRLRVHGITLKICRIFGNIRDRSNII